MWLREVALEVCVANHLFKVGTCLGVAEEILREEDDELIERKKVKGLNRGQNSSALLTGLRKSRLI